MPELIPENIKGNTEAEARSKKYDAKIKAIEERSGFNHKRLFKFAFGLLELADDDEKQRAFNYYYELTLAYLENTYGINFNDKALGLDVSQTMREKPAIKLRVSEFFEQRILAEKRIEELRSQKSEDYEESIGNISENQPKIYREAVVSWLNDLGIGSSHQRIADTNVDIFPLEARKAYIIKLVKERGPKIKDKKVSEEDD